MSEGLRECVLKIPRLYFGQQGTVINDDNYCPPFFCVLSPGPHACRAGVEGGPCSLIGKLRLRMQPPPGTTGTGKDGFEGPISGELLLMGSSFK